MNTLTCLNDYSQKASQQAATKHGRVSPAFSRPNSPASTDLWLFELFRHWSCPAGSWIRSAPVSWSVWCLLTSTSWTRWDKPGVCTQWRSLSNKSAALIKCFQDFWSRMSVNWNLFVWCQNAVTRCSERSPDNKRAPCTKATCCVFLTNGGSFLIWLEDGVWFYDGLWRNQDNWWFCDASDASIRTMNTSCITSYGVLSGVLMAGQNTL